MRAILVVLLLAGVFVVIGSLLPWGDGRAWVPALAAGVTLVILAGVMLARSTDLYLWSLAVAGVAVLAAAWKWGALLEPGLRGPDGIGLVIVSCAAPVGCLAAMAGGARYGELGRARRTSRGDL